MAKALSKKLRSERQLVRTEDISYPRETAARLIGCHPGHSLDDLAKNVSMMTHEKVSVRDITTGEHSRVFLRGFPTGQKPYLS